MPAGLLTPKNYRPRLIERRLDALMKAFGCVEITGAKWCGKTWTALSRSASVARLDEPAEREAAIIDPKLALLGERPHLVDEWQEVPAVWDAARRYVDDSGNARGSLLLTGSTSLSEGKRKDVRHSGTGRIARLTMRPMALCESGDSTAEVSLRRLLEGERLDPIRCSAGIEDIALLCCRGGWPANVGMPDEVALETAGQYVRSVLDVNIAEQRYSPGTAEALMRALAVNEGQAATYKTLAKDMARGERGADDDTIASYLDLFSRIHLIEQLRGWEPPMRSKSRVRVKPKRSFVDPSLAAALLHATPSRLLRDTQTLGMLFESLVLRDLRVFLSTYPGFDNGVYYYRDDKGLEVDAIIEHEGRWAGIEVKLSDAKVDEGARSLTRLRDKISSNAAARNADPAFLAVVVGKGSLAYTRDDGVMVIPAALLGA